MGGPLRVCAVCARILSRKQPLGGVTHCVGHIEMGRVATNCSDPWCSMSVVVTHRYIVHIVVRKKHLFSLYERMDFYQCKSDYLRLVLRVRQAYSLCTASSFSWSL
jgi:hypothetical protein